MAFLGVKCGKAPCILLVFSLVGFQIYDVMWNRLNKMDYTALTMTSQKIPKYSESTGSHSNKGYIVSRKTRNETKNNVVRFVFLMGIEGSGHHLYVSLLRESPNIRFMIKKAWYKNHVSDLRHLLYQQSDEDRSNALWSSTCQTGKDRRRKSRRDSANSLVTIQKLASTLHDMQQQITADFFGGMNSSNHSHIDAMHTVTFPINGMPKPQHGWTDGGKYGMMSYPNFATSCRSLDYPNLDVLYQACDLAGVRCEHIYVYRDPHAIISSTTVKRGFNPSILDAIHLYTTMLQVVFFQLTLHPDRLVTCWDYYVSPSEVPGLAEVFGYYDDDQKKIFANRVASTYHAKPPPSPEKKLEIVPMKLQPYMDTMVSAHQRVVDLCHSLSNA